MPTVNSRSVATVTMTSTGTGPWTTWNQTWTSATTTSTWIAWQSTGTGSVSISPRDGGYVTHPAPYPAGGWDQVAEMRAQERAQRDVDQAGAREAAERLLLSLLSEEQRAQYVERDSIDVVGSSGQRWRIHQGTSGNVEALTEDGRMILRVCAHPRLWDAKNEGYLPTADVMTAQLLALRADDKAFLAKANIHQRGARTALAPGLRRQPVAA